MISDNRKTGLVPTTYFSVEMISFPIIACRILGGGRYYMFARDHDDREGQFRPWPASGFFKECGGTNKVYPCDPLTPCFLKPA
jgi:hypothetical protein